ncbi:glutamate formimidoyltransferase [Desulfotalea psychrophila]|uniref:Formimidoyltransferase-cyclodeaminase n=1 Tax=Desulfotalea psychrophila (strain LSv54 / DSM 12343) TaxID=177439 RepID=Q6AKP6_DESPS|nr:glutamate formimidoyltransferase [Desulfotalea psychrophila]CAG37079.1 probable formiminotransferase-cyclodeaminase [Desulfotalea psychrophila LSv54]
MKKIVECVPNFSEGRDQKIIGAIARAIKETDGCTLLDLDAGSSTNRSVFTFVGDPETVLEGALTAARVAATLIDMRNHSGEHPRFGAMDVCPFIPITGVSMEECVQLARRFAKRAAEELGIPLYLYGAAAEHDYRRELSALRQGEYEGLALRLTEAKWQPDYGPSEFVPSWGITATGARNFLIAYNVNILATPNQAHRIALNLREAGRGEGAPGRLREVRAMGWFVQEYNMAQVTANILDYRVTPIHLLFEEVKEEAGALNLAVAGSEIVGLLPLETLLMAADYYIEKEDLFIYEEEQKIRLAIERLGLNSVAQFKPEEKIIEYRLAEKLLEPLAGATVREFIEEIAARSSAPGGGSASAAIAAIGTALGSMVAKLTHGVRKFEEVQPQMQEAIPVLHQLTQQLISVIDRDSSAFNDYMAGMRLPQSTEEERERRDGRMEAGLKTAINVPLGTMRLADGAWDSFCQVARHGNPASASDTLVGARALETGIWGAYQNVLINMRDIEDPLYREEVLSVAQEIAARAARKCEEVLRILSAHTPSAP